MTRKMTIALTFLMTFLFGYGQSSGISEEIKAHIKERVDQGIHVGIVVGYFDGDKVEYFNYGNRSLNTQDKVDENSVFEIGSITKVFTGILLADQVISENMKLSDPMTKFLPEGVNTPQKDGKQITLKDLATHSSGLPRMPNNFTPENPNNPFADYSKQQIYDFLSGYNLTRDIGASYEYSNYGMGLLGHLLELKTKKSYETLVVEKIANVYQMNDTRIVLTEKMKKNLAKGHAAGKEVENWDIISLAGAGGLRSTARDMIQFLKANTGVKDTPIFKAMKISHAQKYSDSQRNVNLGLGWHHATSSGKKIIWHNGGTGGYRSFAGFIEGTEVGVVVLTNSNVSVDNIALKILDNQGPDLVLPEKDKEAIDLPVSILERYVGVYQLAPTFSITITRKESQLYGQATGQQAFELFPSAETEFFLKVVKASVTFNLDDSGKVTGLVLHQNGQNVPGEKIE